jgi:dienelactone hydrolase
MAQQKTFAHLGVYSDLVPAANRSKKLWPLVRPGKATQKAVREMLAFDPGPPKVRDVRVERTWEADGLVGEVLSWSVGYGPRTEAWLIKPAGAAGRLPGVVALHDHGGHKWLGKEKVAIGPDGADKLQTDWFVRIYGGKAFANEIAKRGYVVLVHDCFCWGSRKMPLETMPDWDKQAGGAVHRQSPMESNPPDLMAEEISAYNWCAAFNEHTVQKYCHVLGTSMAGIMAFEDRVAARYLSSRKDVKAGGVGCVGLSGGGLRSSLLQATSDDIRAAVAVGLMSTYEGLLDHNVVSHTWMLYPNPTWSHRGDWADVISCRAPSPLMVQYDNEDALFTLDGMKAADKRIAKHYKSVGKPKNYVGEFYPGPHKFDVPMQTSAWAFFDAHLKD